jgi:hypothetical protein
MTGKRLETLSATYIRIITASGYPSPERRTLLVTATQNFSQQTPMKWSFAMWLNDSRGTPTQNRGGIGMGNTAPARVAKAQKAAKAKAVKVRGQAGTLDDLKACLWLAVTKCTMAIYQQGPLNDEGRKSIFCLSQISSVYIRAVEATDLESRIQILEEGR